MKLSGNISIDDIETYTFTFDYDESGCSAGTFIGSDNAHKYDSMEIVKLIIRGFDDMKRAKEIARGNNE